MNKTKNKLRGDTMIKVGLVGYGASGSNFHAPIIDMCENTELKYIVSSRINQINKEFPNVDVLSDYSTLLSKDLDLIVIATPNSCHYEQAVKALNAGCNVVIDKPFTPTLSEALKLKEIASRNKKLVTVFHNRRFDGDFKTIKKLINEKKVGEITYFESNFNRYRPSVNKKNWRETSSVAGGIFYDLAPHLIDQAVDIFGKPESVFLDKMTARKEAINDDFFSLTMIYSNLRVKLNASMLSINERERFLCQGTDGAMWCYGLDPQESRLKSKVDHSIDGLGKYSKNIIELRETSGTEIKIENGNYVDFYSDIAESIEKRERPKVSVDCAISVMKVIDSAIESYNTGKVINL